MYSPRPTPSLWVEREESALWNRSKMWVQLFGGDGLPLVADGDVGLAGFGGDLLK